MATSLFAIGEELGWRGYLVPEMAKIARFQSVALASGAIWAIWHWPLILLIPQISGFDQLNPLFAIVSLTFILTGAGVVLAWLTVRSGSLLPAIVMHGAQNAVSQGFLVGHTERTEWSAFLVSEAGALVAVAWVCAGLMVLRLAREA